MIPKKCEQVGISIGIGRLIVFRHFSHVPTQVPIPTSSQVQGTVLQVKYVGI